jgi:anti-sigma factor RsiW
MTPAPRAPGCARWAPMIGARPGELPPEESRAFAEHLAACDACQARLADEEALSGLLPEALMAEASRRDFSSFADGVLARIPEYAAAPGWSPLRSAAREWGGGLRSWIRHHRAAAAFSAFAPALAAAALVLYFGQASAPSDAAPYDVVAEGRAATVLDTADGPMVLFGDPEEPAGT